MKKKLCISFSGGKTSGFMTTKLLENYSNEYEFLITFANTGEENEETLEFVNNCDLYWQGRFGESVVWLESVTHMEHGKGQTHKVVSFETASRDGEPYKQFVAKEGIPNAAQPRCSERLKQKCMDHYRKEKGWTKKVAKTAIGIRVDEYGRRSYYGEKEFNLVYPLLDWFPSDKQDVNDFWEDMPFNLELEEHEGNCKVCWKKGDNKLYLIAKENTERFDVFKEIEKEHSETKANDTKKDLFGDHTLPRRFYRNYRTTEHFLTASKEMDAKTLRKLINAQPDESSGCGESCEPYQKPTQVDIEQLIDIKEI